MAIIVEDGSIVSGANSYVSETEVTDYAAERGITLTAAPSVLIYKSMDYIEGLSFVGMKYTEDQPLQWPRVGVYIDGYYVEVSEIPKELKAAQLSTCISIDQSVNPLADIKPAIKSRKIGPIETQYQDGASSTTFSASIQHAFKKLVRSGGANTIKLENR